MFDPKKPKARFCSAKCRVYWNREKKYSNVISKIDPKAGDRAVLNKVEIENLKKPPITHYVADKFVMEVKEYPLTPEDCEQPNISPEEIKKEISRLMGEQIPKERDTSLGRKSWNKERDKKIEELKKQLL